MNKICKLVIAGVAIAAAVALAGCSSSTPPSPASSSAAPSAAAVSTSAPDVAQTPSAVALSQCSGSDNGLKMAFEAWETLMKSDGSFTAWVKDTADFQSGASSTQSFDSTFGEADGASAAGTLAAALGVVESDLQQGEQTGQAPAAYKADVETAIADEAPFETCASAS